MITKRRTVLGLSAGSGILPYAFKDQFIFGNIEVRSDYYISSLPLQWDLNFDSITTAHKKGYLAFDRNSVDIILSQPKCGNSSVLAYSRGKQMTSHKNEPSLDLSLNGIRHIRPKVFLIENLPALLNSYSEKDLKQLFPQYYLIFHNNVSMIKFGNSQKTRKRLIIVGVLKALRGSAKIRNYAREIFPVSVPKHTGLLIEGCPENGFFRPDINERIAIYGGRQMTYVEIQKMWGSIPTKKRLATPNERFNSAPGVYRDLADDWPATVRKSNRCFAPYGLPYTPRERARIMGLPDTFLIADPTTHPYISPKTLFNKGCISATQGPAYEIGLWFKNVLIKSGFIIPEMYKI